MDGTSEGKGKEQDVNCSSVVLLGRRKAGYATKECGKVAPKEGWKRLNAV